MCGVVDFTPFENPRGGGILEVFDEDVDGRALPCGIPGIDLHGQFVAVVVAQVNVAAVAQGFVKVEVRGIEAQY